MYSDEDKYINESFENDSEIDIPEISESEESLTDGDVHKRLQSDHNSALNAENTMNARNYSSRNRDMVSFDSSDDDVDVIFSETMVNSDCVSLNSTSNREELELISKNALCDREVQSLRLDSVCNIKLGIYSQECEKSKETVDEKSHELDISSTNILMKSMTEALKVEICDISDSVSMDKTFQHFEVNRYDDVMPGDTKIQYKNSDDGYCAPYFEYHSRSHSPFKSDDSSKDWTVIKKFIPIHKIESKVRNRTSFSFSNERMREIDRQNHILLNKILTQKPTYAAYKETNTQKKLSSLPLPQRVTSAAVNRKKKQRQIDLDNQVLRRKIDSIGSRRPLV